jgi:tetratricopeptide (TPR) repeat protein
LRENERYTSGLMRLVVGYDDAAKSVWVRDYGAKKPLAIPYGLFELLWARLDGWWLTVTPADKPPAGKPGELTGLELAVGIAVGGDLEGALKELDAPENAKSDPGRRRLARGMVLWRLGKLEEARKELAPLAEGPAELAVQANLALGAMEEQAAGPLPGRLEAALARYRQAWALDPGGEPATLSLAFALVKRSRPEDLAEAREILEDYLRIQPGCLPALMLRYSF